MMIGAKEKFNTVNEILHCFLKLFTNILQPRYPFLEIYFLKIKVPLVTNYL